MKLNRFFDILNNTQSLKEEEITDLQQITEIYPFFQPAQILYAKALHTSNHFSFQQSIKKIAVVVYDKKQLYNILHHQSIDLASTIINTASQEVANEATDIQTPISTTLKHDSTTSDTKQYGVAKTLEIVVNVAETEAGTHPQTIEKISNVWVKKEDDIYTPTEKEVIENNENKIMYFIYPKKEEVEVKEEKTIIQKLVNDSDAYQNEIAKAMVNAYTDIEILEIDKINKVKAPKSPTNEVSEVQEHSIKENIDAIDLKDNALEIIAESEDNESINDTKHSDFADWLKHLKEKNTSSIIKNEVNSMTAHAKKPLESSPNLIIEQKTTEKEEENIDLDTIKRTKLIKEHQEIIDKIIKIEPKINKPKGEFFNSANKAKDSVVEDNSIVSETLARIYAMQGNLSKAMKTYEILSLKFPEKSAYFAALIKELKIK